MGAFLVCQHQDSGHDSLATLVSVMSWESMLASLNPSVIELYNRAYYSAICRLGKSRPNHKASATTWESYTQCHLDVGPALQG
jgi:hypothetical protein